MTPWLHSQRTQSLVLLSALILLALALGFWQSAASSAGRASWPDSALTTISRPLQSLLLGATRHTENAWNVIAHSRRLAKDNARLSARVAALEAQLASLREARAANQRERALLSAHPQAGRPHTIAHVIGLNTGGWPTYLVVDRGAAHHVQVRDIAVGADGLVGQVYAVAAHTARVLPITDPTSGVAIRLQRSRETGILKGLSQWRCEIRCLAPDADVRPGDRILTAGIGGIFPQGLLVGAVTSVSPDGYTPGKVAAVQPAVPLRRVEEVLLLPSAGRP